MTSRARVIASQTAVWASLVAALAAQAPEQLTIDRAGTSITIQVGRAGVFGFAGHDHEIAAPVVQGKITLDRSDITRSRISMTFDATALRVTGKGEPADDVPEVQKVMLSERVLDVQRYPTIAFQSRRISMMQRSADRLTLRIAGDLTLHGVTRPLNVPVNVRLTASGFSADGKASVRQTDFGIRPVTAGAGTVRVKDEIDIIFSVTARRP
jgi:polyisoprenoid-binding protein YceI